MKNNSPVLRALYIILVPMVLLIILLNSGWLQRFIPAASIQGESYSVVRYNYYYYDYQTTFLHAHEHELDALGYDPNLREEKQAYDSTTTWKEFFQQEAELDMAETAYYCALAEQAGYVFSEEELLPISEKIAANEQQRELNGISEKNYYIAYYGPGMDLDRYTEELTQVVKARAYKQYLIDTAIISDADIQSYMAANPEEDYSAVNVQLISIEAVTDRATGLVGEAQLDALEDKLSALQERYQSGVSFGELQAAFSTCEVGGREGVFTATKSVGLCDGLEELLLEQQEGLTAGDTLSYIDRETSIGYFVLIDGFAGNGRAEDAHNVLAEQAIAAQLDAALQGDYQVERNGFGMLLAAS